MNKNFKRAAQGGFTLIELIVVIVILGILAATALPKFADLSGDARKASLQAAKASISSVSAMAHGKFLVDPVANKDSIKMENVSVTMASGYPGASAALATAAGLSEDDYTISPSPSAASGTAATTVTVSPKGVTTAASCQVTYTPAKAASDGTITPPTIVVPTTINCN